MVRLSRALMDADTVAGVAAALMMLGGGIQTGHAATQRKVA
jgi:hypothetical protein